MKVLTHEGVLVALTQNRSDGTFAPNRLGKLARPRS